MITEKEIARVRALVRHTEIELEYVVEMLGHYRRQLAELLAAKNNGKREALQ